MNLILHLKYEINSISNTTPPKQFKHNAFKIDFRVRFSIERQFMHGSDKTQREEP